MKLAKFGVKRVAVSLLEERAQRQRRAAVGPLDERRHALAHVVVGGRHLEDAAPRVRVDVDETGRHDQTADVDRPRRRLRYRRGDADDGVALDRQIGAIPRAAGAVDDASVAKDEIVAGRLGGKSRRGEKHDKATRRMDGKYSGTRSQPSGLSAERHARE